MQYFSQVFFQFRARALFLCCIAAFMSDFSTAFAQAEVVELQLSLKPNTGEIAISPAGFSCISSCRQEFPKHLTVSLTATALPGYRFLGWTGACKNSLGPLCVLQMESLTEASAEFTPLSANLTTGEKTLLLVHGLNANHEVWNDFVAQHFADQCPRIYGGVILGKDTVNSNNGVHCYRVEFGYHDAFSQRKGLDRLTPLKAKMEGQLTAGDFSTPLQLGLEVQAAVLRIGDLHPQTRLVILSHNTGNLAALNFMNAQSSATLVVQALLMTGAIAQNEEIFRFYKTLHKNDRRSCEDSDCQSQWQFVDHLKSRLFSSQPESNFDLRKPLIGDLNTLTQLIDQLQKFLPKTQTLVVYDGTSYSLGDSFSSTPPPEADLNALLEFYLAEWWTQP